jgi:hypothetical protein
MNSNLSSSSNVWLGSGGLHSTLKAMPVSVAWDVSQMAHLASAASKSLPHTALLFFSQSRSIVGAAGAEAARTALAAGDFGTVYQRVAVFDLLGMVAATVRARGHLSLVELHIPDGMRRSNHISAYG